MIPQPAALLRFLADLADVQERHYKALAKESIDTVTISVALNDSETYTLFEDGWVVET